MGEKIVMGYWDCPFCGSTGIPGTTYDCPNCGRQRGKETKFYMKEGTVEYVPGHKVSGADWYCDYCGALNSAERTTCENCGSQRDESKEDYFSLKEPKTDNFNNNFNNTESSTSNEKKSASKFITFGIIALIILMVILISRFLSRPKDSTFLVQSMSWENSIKIEENKTFRESDWKLPDGARLAYTKSEIRSYESVLDHYESVTKSRQVQDGGHYETSYSDNGDGSFTEHSTFVPDYTTEYYTEEEPVYRKEPVYDTKYYYDIDKWVDSRTETSSGNDKNPYWPDLNLTEKEREAGRSSTYSMSGELTYKSLRKYKTKTVKYTIDEAMWKAIDIGQTISLTLKNGKITAWQYE
ncbi:zinc finger Ran-binding domain-containing protein [Butyrivibrio sp. AE3004]|uniref:zinc finger Ran-binding domain-containing protein n=1 Tax=Butyrivibrio sp. AE3004 TaxID=1506994 RepID=UPI000493F6BE|nr:zinc finger Ran-binding domain-containing protein [Butyrivibrio sp. AE3004]